MNQTTRPWYKKKRYIIPIAGIATLVGIGSMNNVTPSQTSVEGIQAGVTATQALVAPTTDESKLQTVTPTLTPTPTPTVKQTPKPTAAIESGLSNDNYYTNVDGNEIHSPAKSNSQPPDA